MILESIKTVFKVFKTNKMRTFLTMLGMIIGIFSITIIFSLSDSTKKIMSDELSMVSSEGIYLSYDAENYIQNNLVENDLKEYINKNKLEYSVTSYFTPMEISNLLESNSESEDYYLPEFKAVDENYFDSADIEEQILHGRLLNRKDIVNKMPYVVIREDIAKELLGVSNIVGQTIELDNHEFEVVGILKYDELQSSEFSDVGMYISYYYAKDYMDTYGLQYKIVVTEQNKDQVKKELSQIMEEYFSTKEYIIRSADDLGAFMDGMNNVIDIVEFVFAGIAGLSIVVGGIGIMNIMLVSVSERIKETGIRMALGAKNRDIIVQFLIEGIMITILSGIIGILLASGATSIINLIVASFDYEFTLIINFMTMVKIIFFCGIIGIIFGIYPAIKAGRLDPVEALKYDK